MATTMLLVEPLTTLPASAACRRGRGEGAEPELGPVVVVVVVVEGGPALLPSMTSLPGVECIVVLQLLRFVAVLANPIIIRSASQPAWMSNPTLPPPSSDPLCSLPMREEEEEVVVVV